MADILDALLNLVALALLSAGTAGVGWLAPRIARTLRLADDQRVRAYLLQTVEVAVEYGQAEARRRLRGQPAFTTSEVAREREAALAAKIAETYVTERVPDALAHFDVGAATLGQMIRARLPNPPPGTAG